MEDSSLGASEMPSSIFYPPSSTRLYKTGDLARRRADGMFEFVEETVGQAWVRGCRVDLCELETAIGEQPSVDECVVLARASELAGMELVAYVVGALRMEDLRAYLQSQLPAAMLPSAYVPISSMPLTPAGRIDEQAWLESAGLDDALIQRWETALPAIPGGVA